MKLPSLIRRRAPWTLATPFLAASGIAFPGQELAPAEWIAGTPLRQIGALEVVDIDGDGLFDIVAASQANGRICVLQGTAPGEFGAPVRILDEGPRHTTMLIADLDGDGDLDLILRGATSVLEWMENLGGMNFGAPAPLGSGSPRRPLEIADINSDGYLDVLLAPESSGYEVVVTYGSAGPSFGAPVRVSVNYEQVNDTSLADVNGDGKADVLYLQRTSPSSWDLICLPQGPAGALLPPVILRSGSTGVQNTSLEWIDINVDGHRDLLIARGSTADYDWMEADGQGGWIDQGPLDLDGNGHVRAIADIDGDGDEDVLHYSNYAMRWSHNVGGSFVEGPAVLEDASTFYVAPADIDLDGDLDLISASGYDAIYVQTTDGGLPNSVPVALYEWSAMNIHSWVDLDHDGLKEIVAARSSLVVLSHGADGTFTRNDSTITGSALGSYPTLAKPVQWADLDGDGTLDMSYARDYPAQEGGDCSWARGTPTAMVSPQSLFWTFPAGVGKWVFLDLDRDGDEDMIYLKTYEFSPTRRHRWFNAGDGTNDGLAIDAQFAGVPALAIDYNGDGYDDLLSYWAGTISLEENLGSGLLGTPSTYPTDNLPTQEYRVGDFNGDSRLDILRVLGPYSIGSNPPFWIYLNTGQGMTLPMPIEVPVPAGSLPRQVEVADMNGDGFDDILYRRSGDARIEIIRSLGPVGPGSLDLAPAEILIDGLPSHSDFAVADVDGDLDQDVSVLFEYEIEIHLYRNEAELGTVTCTSLANSTGAVGQLSATGSDAAHANQLRLRAHNLPAQSTSLFLLSSTAGTVVQPGGSQGILCLGGSIGRFSRTGEIQMTDSSGQVSFRVPMTDIPSLAGVTSLAAGETWYFQCWHRDFAGTPTSNFSSSLALTLR